MSSSHEFPQGSLFVQDPDSLAQYEMTPGQLEADRFFNPSTPASVEPASQQTELEHLKGYKELLGTFGSMNKGENFRNRFHEGSVIVDTAIRPRYGENTNERFDASVEGSAGLESKARGKVADMLGTKALVKAGVVSEEQERAITDSTFKHYAGQFQGIVNKDARKSEAGKIDRRIKKLESE